MKHLVVRNAPRADADVVEALGEFGVATVHEAQGAHRPDAPRTCARSIRRRSVAGTAVTVCASPATT